MLQDRGPPSRGPRLPRLFSSDGDLRVSEVWGSEEQFEAFGKQLTPVLAEVGITAEDPPAHSRARTAGAEPGRRGPGRRSAMRRERSASSRRRAAGQLADLARVGGRCDHGRAACFSRQ